jgi:hypothetical protein
MALDEAILQEVLGKCLTLGEHQWLAGCARGAEGVTERRACRVRCASQAMVLGVSVKRGQEELRVRPAL